MPLYDQPLIYGKDGNGNKVPIKVAADGTVATSGGGGGGGTASSVTINDGTDTLAINVDGSLNAAIVSSIPAGTNNIGDVDVLTLPVAFNTGTTGSTTIRTVSASNSPDVNSLSSIDSKLPSGLTVNGDKLKVDSAVTGTYNTSLPTLINGQTSDLQVDSNGKLLVAAEPSAPLEITIPSTSSTGTLIASTNISTYSTFSVQLIFSGFNGTIYFEGSNDNSTWSLIKVQTSDGTGNAQFVNGSFSYSGSAPFLLCGSLTFKFFRLRLISISSGSVSGVALFSKNSKPVYETFTYATVTGTVTATSNGNVAAAATDSGNPVKIGGVYSTSLPTYSNGQRGNLQIDANGRLLTSSTANLNASYDTGASDATTIRTVTASNSPDVSKLNTIDTSVSSINTKIPSNLTVTSTRLLVDGSGVTQPISASALPLPSGASTAANQSTGNTSLSSIDTKLPSGLTVTSTRLLTDSSGVTQPISAASLPLPTGAATATKQDTGNTSLSSIDTKLPSNLTVTSTRLLVDGSGVTQPVSFAANALTPNLFQITLTSANTEYSSAITSAKKIAFKVLSGGDVRYAYATGKVATPTAPYYTLNNLSEESEDFTGNDRFTGTLYLASATAGTIVILKVWS